MNHWGEKEGPGPSDGARLGIYGIHTSKQPLMVRTSLKVYMELGSSFLFLQEQIKDIIIIIPLGPLGTQASLVPVGQTGSRDRSNCRCCPSLNFML